MSTMLELFADAYLRGASVDLEGTTVVGAKDPDDMAAIRRFAVAYLRNEQNLDLAAFGVDFDIYFLESSLYADGKVAEQGAQVLSWVSDGRERLFLSPRSALDGSAPIRGGVPVCWPQFNQRGDLPKHGFARHLPWLTTAYDLGVDAASLDIEHFVV